MQPTPSLNRFFANAVLFLWIVLLAMAGARTALAEELPVVPNVMFDGTNIIWDALDVAHGYNIYRDKRYVDTVIGSTTYPPASSGDYQVAAFDGNGNYTPLGGSGRATTIAVTIDTTVSEALTLQNVRGTVYSDSAGELKWDRSSLRGVRYRVELNGVSLGITDGASFWIDSLFDNSQNQVSVTAVSFSGLDTLSVTLVFDTRSNSFPIPATDMQDNEPPSERPDEPPSELPNGLASPQNASLEIYSSTAAELFWDRPLRSDNVINTEVFRNNERIGISPGASFFDDTRTPDTQYTYELIAVDNKGTRSAPTVINPTALDGTTEEVVLRVLAGISEATTANPHVTDFPVFQSILSGLSADDLVEISSQTISDGATVTITTYECLSGSLDVISVQGESSTATTRINFDECSIQDLSLVFGSMEISSVAERILSVEYDELFYFNGDLDIYVNGNVSMEIDLENATRSIRYSNFEYNIFSFFVEESSIGIDVLLNQTVAYSESAPDAPSTLTTSLTANADWTGGRDVTVTTNSPFLANGTPHYTAGSLTAITDLDESLKWSADTGDVGTWFVEVNTAVGTTSSTGNWSSLVSLPCIVLEGNCQ